jgi:hypothetical protein
MFMLVKRHIGQRPGHENKLLLALIVPIINRDICKHRCYGIGLQIVGGGKNMRVNNTKTAICVIQIAVFKRFFNLSFTVRRVRVYAVFA